MRDIRRVNVVLGFQFQSACRAYTKEALLDTFRAACKAAERQLKRRYEQLSVQPVSECAQVGLPLSEQIVELFTTADVGVFEISDVNPNVMYEAGLLTGRRLRPILIRNRNKSPVAPPSDIAGLLVLNYDRVPELKASLAVYIANRVETLLEGTDPLAPWIEPFQTPWFEDDGRTSPIVIVCGHVPTREIAALRRAKHPDLTSQIDHFTDKESLLEVTKTLSTLYPQREQRRYTSREISRNSGDLKYPLVSLGGPDFNEFYRRIEADRDIPLRYVPGSGSDATLVDSRSGHKYRATRKKRVPVADYGLYLRLSHPVNGAERLLMFSGITALGVLGAVRAFAAASEARQNALDLSAHLGEACDFGVLVRVNRVFGTQFKAVVDWKTAWEGPRR
jgi:hypothetical protein